MKETLDKKIGKILAKCLTCERILTCGILREALRLGIFDNLIIDIDDLELVLE